MRDEDKTKEQLINELLEMRMRVAELEGLQPRKRSPQPDEFGTVAEKKAGTKSAIPENDSTADISEYKRTLEEVLESPLKWQVTFNSVSDAICLLDMEGRVLDCNEAMLKLLGKPTIEVVGKTCWKLIHGTSEPIDGCPVVRMRKSRTRESMELPVGDQWFDVSADPIVDEAGDLVGAVHILSDITERKRAEEALLEREATLKSIFRAAPIGIGMVAGRILKQVNDQLCEMVGYSREELIGQSARVLYPSQDEFDWVGTEKYRQIGEGGAGTVETLWKRKDGQMIDVLLSSAALDPSDLSVGVTFTALDITERKQAQEKLAEMQSLLLAAIEQSPAGILIADAPDVTIRVANSAALGIRGENSEPLTKIPVELHPKNWQVFHADGMPYKPEALPLSEAVLFGKTSQNVEAIIRRSSGEDRWVLANAAPVRNTEGRIIAGVVVFPDITELKQAEEALKRSEEKYRELVENVNSIILRMDKTGNITFFNEFAQRFFGYNEEEILGKNGVGTIVPEVESTGRDLRAMIEDIGINPHRYINNINENVRRDGERVWVAWTNKPILDNNGHVLEVLCIGNDITDRKRAEEALREGEARFRSLIKLAPIPLCFVNPEGVLSYFNDRFVQLFGYTSADVPTLKEWWQLAYPDETYRRWAVETWEAAVARAAREGTDIEPIEYNVTCKNGTVRVMEISGITIGDNFLASFIDLTAHKRVEAALRQSEARYRTILQTALDGFWTADMQGRLLDVNAAYCRMSGYSEPELLAMRIPDLEAVESNADTASHIHKVIAQGEDRFETRHRRKDGSIFDVAVSVQYRPIESGRLVAFLSDITERKKAEEALKESQQQLADIINFLPDATLVVDKGGKVIAWNRAIEEMTGIKAGDMLGKGNYEYALPFYGERRPILIDLVLKPLVEAEVNYVSVERKDGVLEGEAYMPALRGGEVYLFGKASVLRDSKGDIVGAIESIRDISERRHVEEALARAEGKGSIPCLSQFLNL